LKYLGHCVSHTIFHLFLASRTLRIDSFSSAFKLPVVLRHKASRIFCENSGVIGSLGEYTPNILFPPRHFNNVELFLLAKLHNIFESSKWNTIFFSRREFFLRCFSVKKYCGAFMFGTLLAPQLPEGDGCGGSDVEGVYTVGHGDADDIVGFADDVTGQTVALGAHDDSETRFGFQP